ncbi:MAG: FKBP-type peptidyl-prolyl cis-trans isomerase [Victivallales bacterium]|nr:FKBP-type peptidyl-prolyl cis-trans isomerase [Victivallales bacterium]
MSLSLTTDSEKTSYALGMDIGASFKRLPVKISLAAAVAGITDVFTEQPLQLPEKEFVALMQKFQEELRAAGEKHAQVKATENRRQQEEFLAANKKHKDVSVTASGLQYKVLNAGQGKKPMGESVVSVHYTGTLPDGTVFDSSVQRGEPATFPVNGVIAGWTEALQLMQVGSKYQLFIPANLAYGNRGAGAAIGPDQMLIFEVELLDIVG